MTLGSYTSGKQAPDCRTLPNELCAACCTPSKLTSCFSLSACLPHDHMRADDGKAVIQMQQPFFLEQVLMHAYQYVPFCRNLCEQLVAHVCRYALCCRDYCEGLRDSLDLVVIGAWQGQGRKVKWFSPFLLAAWDPETEEYQSVCRCMSGFTDAFYADVSLPVLNLTPCKCCLVPILFSVCQDKYTFPRILHPDLC